jgi:hypothetical protein
MNYSENMNYLLKNFNSVYSQINQLNENQKSDENLIVEKSKNNLLTLKKDGKYIHSKYDPLKEAEKIINDYSKEIENYEYIFFYGVGLGYHIENFIKKYPEKKIILYEPDKEIFYNYLKYGNLNKINNKNILNIYLKHIESSFFNYLMKKYSFNFFILYLTSYKNIFSKEYDFFCASIKKFVEDKKNNIHVNYSMQKKWIENSMKNFKKVLTTPNILLDKKKYFKGKTAIIAAAGPSLNEEIDNLKYIKNNRLAYIFSVGSAINTLIHYKLFPDAAITYDPFKFNSNVFKTLKSNTITEIPLIFGSSVYHGVIEDYPGKMIHMITSQDTISNYFLKPKNEKEKIDFVFDAPSISVISLQLLFKLEFNRIIFVGQNLAFKENKYYSEGINWGKSYAKQKKLLTKDVYGNDISTNKSFKLFKEDLEKFIKAYKENKYFEEVVIINSTKGGAHIEGTVFKTLEEVIKDYLKDKVVNENWYNIEEIEYDLNYLKEKKLELKIDFNKVVQLISELEKYLIKIKKLSKNRNLNQIEKMYLLLDNLFDKIIKNKYFNLFIIPMNRLQYEFLDMEINKINSLKDPYKKSEKVIEEFEKFMFLCKKDYEYTIPIFEEINENIVKILKERDDINVKQ